MTWQKGQSGNPAGRPKGAHNLLSETVLLEKAIADWVQHYNLMCGVGKLA